MIPFFVIHYGIFWLVHGIFVLTLPLFGMMAGDGADDLVTGVSPATILFAVIALTISHGVSYYFNFLKGGEYRRVSAAGQMFAPYGRLVVLHVTIIFGRHGHRRSPGARRPPSSILVVLKTALDVGFHLAEHRRGPARPAGDRRRRPDGRAGSGVGVRGVVQDALGLAGAPRGQALAQRVVAEARGSGRRAARR